MDHAKNIESVLKLADEVDLTEGRQAYWRHHHQLRSVAEYHKVGFVQTVAAFSALSPNNDYVGNMRSLISLIEGIGHGIPEDEITISTYNACTGSEHTTILSASVIF
jgi:hypothetical protein